LNIRNKNGNQGKPKGKKNQPGKKKRKNHPGKKTPPALETKEKLGHVETRILKTQKNHQRE